MEQTCRRLLIMVALLTGCADARHEERVPVTTDQTTSAVMVGPTVHEARSETTSPIRFEHVIDAGVDFLYYGNPSPQFYMTEQNGGGVAIFDFDHDGWDDIFFSNGDHFDRPARTAGATHHLYRNHTTRQSSLHFENVAQNAGMAESGFGMGAVAGDVNNDGFADLFVCYYGLVQLWCNNGDGTFTDITSQSEIIDTSWSTSAAFADLDDDGDLDLYVANYVDYSFSDPPCFMETPLRIPISCTPLDRSGQGDRLWENLGDGTFVDSSDAAGINVSPAGKGLAVEIVDLDGDGRLDIYVANDTTENFYFRNDGGLKFTEIATQRGVAVGQKGTPESSMGIGCADYDHDGRLDLFVTNFENAINDFYLNVTDGGFLHASTSYGLDLPSRPMLAFGTIAADFDLDHWPDLFVANGHIWDLTAAKDGHQYQMTPQLFRNESGQRFEDVSRQSGSYFTQKWLGRSAATGDLDNDGAPDVVISQQLAPAAILRNTTEVPQKTLSVQLIGLSSTRQPLGTRVIVDDGEHRLLHHVPAGGSYQASSSPQIIVPCSMDQATVSLDVIWTKGREQTWKNLPSSGRILLIESHSKAVILP